MIYSTVLIYGVLALFPDELFSGSFRVSCRMNYVPFVVNKDIKVDVTAVVVGFCPLVSDCYPILGNCIDEDGRDTFGYA